jgi:hypothetical protein
MTDRTDMSTARKVALPSHQYDEVNFQKLMSHHLYVGVLSPNIFFGWVESERSDNNMAQRSARAPRKHLFLMMAWSSFQLLLRCFELPHRLNVALSNLFFEKIALRRAFHVAHVKIGSVDAL